MEETIYQLWDTETGNLIEVFQTLTAALQAVRETVEQDGVATVEMWGLELAGGAGAPTVIGAGAALAERALAISLT